MSYIPQYVAQATDNTITPPPNATSWQISTPGTGYVVGDVLTLVGGGYTIPATASVTAIDGSGGVVAFNEFVASGVYSSFPGPTCATSGGHGSGCAVTVGGSEIGFSTTNSGLGSTLSQCTICMCVMEHIFNPVLWMNGYSGGLFIEMQGEVQEQTNDPTLQLTLLDASAATIFDGIFTWPAQTTTIPTYSTSLYGILLSFDTRTQRAYLFVNDAQWPLLSGGWRSSNPVANPYGTIQSWSIGVRADIGAIAQFYVAPTYTDLTVTANRRGFLNDDGTPVDPSTYPSAPVNLYLNKGDVATGFAANHGTGGPWSIPASTYWYFSMEYWRAAVVATPINTSVSIDFLALGFGTVRPGATPTFNRISASHGTVSATSGGVIIYTPPSDFTGFDYVGFQFGVSMPTGYTQPTWPNNFYMGGSVLIEVGPVTIVPEINRTDIELVHLNYLLNEISEETFNFPTTDGGVGFADKPVIQTQSYDNYDPDTDSDTQIMTLQELSPTGQITTQYGTADPNSNRTYNYSIWGDRVAGMNYRSQDVAYFYAPYVAGTANPEIPWVDVAPADLGFSSNWFSYCWPIVWLGLTNPFAFAWDYDTVTQRFDAYVASHEGTQVIRGVMYGAQVPTSNSPWIILPDPDTNANLLLTISNNSNQLHIHKSSSLDGSTIADFDFACEAADVTFVLTDGILGDIFQVLVTPTAWVIFGPNNRFAQSSNDNVALPKGIFCITLAKDLSGYTLQFIGPNPDDAYAFALLNSNQPYPYMVVDLNATPYYMGYPTGSNAYPPDGTILSTVAPAVAPKKAKPRIVVYS